MASTALHTMATTAAEERPVLTSVSIMVCAPELSFSKLMNTLSSWWRFILRSTSYVEGVEDFAVHEELIVFLVLAGRCSPSFGSRLKSKNNSLVIQSCTDSLQTCNPGN